MYITQKRTIFYEEKRRNERIDKEIYDAVHLLVLFVHMHNTFKMRTACNLFVVTSHENDPTEGIDFNDRRKLI